MPQFSCGCRPPNDSPSIYNTHAISKYKTNQAKAPFLIKGKRNINRLVRHWFQANLGTHHTTLLILITFTLIPLS